MAAELEYYKEQLEHGGHIEAQRTAVAGLAATISGAIIVELLKELPLTRAQLRYTLTLLFLGLVAVVLSAKLYERCKLHNAIAKEASDALDPNLGKLRANAEIAHKKEFPLLYVLPLHIIWNPLFAVISLVGLISTLVILCR